MYGLWCWNRRRVRRWKERGIDGAIYNRVKNEDRPREQWVVVPVPLEDSGLSRTLADAAKEVLAENLRRRPASTVARRFWQLSGSIAKCGVCGNGFSPHTVHSQGRRRVYYRCFTRYNSGLDACSNGRNMAAPALEESVWTAVVLILSEPERLLRQYEKHIERQRKQMHRDPEQEVRELHGKLNKLERRRSGYLDLAADGDMSRDDLHCKLADLDEQRKGLRKALVEAEARQQAIRGPEANHAHLNDLLDMSAERLDRCSAEDRRRIYEALRLQVHIGEDRSIRVSGIFSPEAYLLEVLRDAPDMDMPRPELLERKGRIVTLDSSPRYTS